MNAIQLIEHAVQRAARRRRWAHAGRGFGYGLLAGGLVWLLAVAGYKLFPIPQVSLVVAGGLAAALALGGAVVGAARKISLLETARWVDEKMKLQERLSTALEVSRTTAPADWQELIVSDAAAHASKVDPRQLSPFRLPVVSRWALVVLALGGGLGFVPEYRSKDYLKKKADEANIKDTGKQLAEFTRRNLEQRAPALAPTQKAIESVAELGEKLTKASLTRGDALKDLASLSDKLSQQVKELGQNPALKPLERAAREPGGGKGQTQDGLQKQMDALQKSLGNNSTPDALDKMKKDLQAAQQAMKNLPDKDSAAGKAAREQLGQAMADLAKKAGDMGQSLAGLQDAIKALANNQTDLAISELQNALTDLEKLKDMAKAMQNLQQQMAKLGKDLAEQLKNGQAQAAQQTLQKMIDQLKSANLSKEQLDKIVDEVAKAVEPGSQYGKVGDLLKQAAQQAQAGQKSDAAQSLAEAQKELDRLAQQMADAQAMKDALGAMDRAQMAIAMGKSWSQCQGQGGPCSSCNGAGCGQCQGQSWKHGGKPGRGVGTWAEESGWTYFTGEQQATDNSGIQRPDMDAKGHTDRPDDLNPNLMPDKVRGKMSEGGPMPSIPLKGVSIKGTSKVQYEEAATAAQTEAQSALNQDQVPRAYQGAVRSYFDELKK